MGDQVNRYDVQEFVFAFVLAFSVSILAYVLLVRGQ